MCIFVHQRGQQAINTTRKSSYKCEDCMKILKTNRMMRLLLSLRYLLPPQMLAKELFAWEVAQFSITI
jgi:hypothetical protein